MSTRFEVDVRDVPLDGAHAQHQLIADLLTGTATRQESQDLDFAASEAVGIGFRARALRGPTATQAERTLQWGLHPHRFELRDREVEVRQGELPFRRVAPEQELTEVEAIQSDFRTEADTLGGSKRDFIA
jgi:hypothetical protein